MSITQLLRRFDFTVLKNKSGTDNTQVPAAATLIFYRQGATVRTSTTLLPSEPPVERDIVVDDVGLIEIGDLIRLGVAGPEYEVTNLIGRDKVRILYTGTSSFQLQANTRLLAPTVSAYRDSRGSQALTPPYSTDSTTGRFGAYVHATRFDFTVSGSGFSSRTYLDYDGGPSVSALGWLLSRDYASLEAAVAACPDHQETTIVLEPIQYLRPDTLVLPPNKLIRLMGAGRDLTVLSCSDVNKPTVWIKNSSCGLEALTVRGPGGAGTGAGIVIGRLAADQPAPPVLADIVRRTRLHDVQVQFTPSWGIELLGNDDPGCNGNSISLFGRFDGVTIDQPRSNGAIRIGRGNTTQAFTGCECVGFVGHGILARGADGLTFTQVTCETASVTGAPPFAEFEDCRSVSLIDAWFEEMPAPPPQTPRPWFIHVKGGQSQGFSLLGCIANRQPNAASPPGSQPPPSYKSRAVLIEGRDTVTIEGLVTSTPDLPGFGERREDIEIRMTADPNDRPTLILTAGTAGSGANMRSLDVLYPSPVYTETALAASVRTFAPFQTVRVAAYSGSGITLLRAQGPQPPGSLVFNMDLNRFEYHDGTEWRFVTGSPVN